VSSIEAGFVAYMRPVEFESLTTPEEFDRGTLSPTYVKPFDVFAKGSETGDWLVRPDSNYEALLKPSS
jgi:hypothetical protein